MADAVEYTGFMTGERVGTERVQPPERSSSSHWPIHEPSCQVIIPSGESHLENEDMQSLGVRLRNKFEQSGARENSGSDAFLPRKALTEILTNKAIQSLLQQNPGTIQVNLSDITGVKRRTKIFAILLLMQKIEYIGRLVQQDVSDADLPLKCDCLRNCLGSDDLVDSFELNQHRVHVPVWDFSAPNIRVETYACDQKLPFLVKQKLSSGGQGTVSKVKIHLDHFETKIQSNRWERLHGGPDFALKEFDNENDFSDELAALKHFSQDDTKHPHLIKALAAYSHCEKHFLIFPLAQGNLVKFWQDAGLSSRDPLWLLVQCHGLAEGLDRIHQYYGITKSPSRNKRLLGRHGDIKPENILQFRDPTTGQDRLVLSDFTLMRFHAEGSNKDTTLRRIGGTKTYRAPEIDLMPGKKVSQKYDVWSLGCVFLEFISCHLVGYDATRGSCFKGDDGRDCQSFGFIRFMEDLIEWGYPEDKYFLYKRELKQAEVKNSVRQWFLYLHGHRNCSDALHDFLDVIQEHMLVHRPKSRGLIKTVLERLGKILALSRRPEGATAYCNVGRPRDSSLDDKFPPLWNEDEYCQRRRQHFDSQASTESGLTSSAFPDGSAKSRDREALADADGSKHDFGQIEIIFADEEIMPSRSSEPARSTAAATVLMPPKDGDGLQNGPTSHEGYLNGQPKASTEASRQKLDPSRCPAHVPNQLLDLSPAIAHQNARYTPYTELLSVNGNLRVPYKPPEPGLLSTPTTSYCRASSDAQSTCTEDPRLSMSSRTDESILEIEECSGQSHRSEELYSVAKNDMSKSEAPAPSPPGDRTNSDDAERADNLPAAEDIEASTSRRHGLASLWKNLRSLRRRAFRPIMGRARRRLGMKGGRS